MKKVLMATLVVVAALSFCAPASAQVDYWKTGGDCLAAEGGPFYYPTIIHQQPLADNEVVGGLSRPSCVDMQLPDRLVGRERRGWVRIGDDRKVVFDKTTGKPIRLAECNNKIFNVAPLPLLSGEDGKDGRDGYTPKKGIDYVDGKDGRDGYTPIKGVDYRDGRDGRDGLDGKDAPPSWWDRNWGWVAGGIIVVATVISYVVAKNNSGGEVVREIVTVVPVAAGVPPGAIIGPIK